MAVVNQGIQVGKAFGGYQLFCIQTSIWPSEGDVAFGGYMA
jgi:hypothetical protein